MHILSAADIINLNAIWHDIEHFTGMDNLSGPFYGFWSGFGSDITEFALLGALISIYKQHKCASCWRVGRHPVEGTPYLTCHKHSTVANHANLHRKHELKFPLQHKLFNLSLPKKDRD